MTTAKLAYAPLEPLIVPRPVHRIASLQERCRGLRVLDLGAMDETAYRSKRGTGAWLHAAIAGTATSVLGIDSSNLVPEGGLVTAPNAVIQRGDVCRIDQLVAEGAIPQLPDLILAGELIEHLANPLAFLSMLATIPRFKGRRLLLTTPNSTALHNVLVGMLGRESMHHDHLLVLSYKTLNTLCLRAGFASWTITPYYADFPEMRARHAGLGRALIAFGQKAVNIGEWLFPLLSFGYIVDIEI